LASIMTLFGCCVNVREGGEGNGRAFAHHRENKAQTKSKTSLTTFYQQLRVDSSHLAALRPLNTCVTSACCIGCQQPLEMGLVHAGKLVETSC
jgi:hypothetical protein